MIAVFRVDASTQIGSGHVMRCLTLAQKLKKEKQAKVYFVMRLLEGNLIKLVMDNGFIVLSLPEASVNNDLQGYAKWLTVTQKQDAKDTIDVIKELQNIDLLVVDSYAIDYIWENELRPYVKQIMVIDDLANRKHNCDILLDQNFYLNKEERYKGLVPENCKLYLGPKFALLREEFYKVKENLRERDGNIKNILVFFGGSDLTNETEKAIKAIKLLNKPDITVNVVVGKGNKNKEKIKKLCEQNPQFKFYCQVDNMAELMNKADLAIGAGGTAIWELLYLEVPNIVIATAENQIEVCENLRTIGRITYIGKYYECDVWCMLNAINNYNKFYFRNR